MTAGTITAGRTLADIRLDKRLTRLGRQRAVVAHMEAEAASWREFADWLANHIASPAPRARSVDELPAMQRWRMRSRGGWVPTRPASAPEPDRVGAYMSQPDLREPSWWDRLLRREAVPA